MRIAFQRAVQRADAQADAQRRHSEARGGENTTENEAENKSEIESEDFSSDVALPQMLLLVRDDCELAANSTAVLSRLLASAPCAGHLWTLERGGVLVLGAEHSVAPFTSTSRGGIRGGLARKCSSPALVAAPTLQLQRGARGERARGGTSGGGERGDDVDDADSAPCDEEVSVLLFTVTFYANHAHNLTRSP